MVNLIQAIFLGIVQGITEWLPISSSGHLAIIQQMFGMSTEMTFYIFLHFGTALSAIVFFRKELLQMVKSAVKLDFASESGRMILLLLVGSLPIVVAGMSLYNTILGAFSSLTMIGIALITTGTILYMTRFMKRADSKDKKISYKNALLIGVAQAVALVPGISRSGVTMSMAMSRRIEREKAFAFSFMLALPAIFGAMVYDAYLFSKMRFLDGSFAPVQIYSFEMLVGTAVAAVIGHYSLKFLRRIVIDDRLYLFAYYCWIVGSILIVYRLF